MLLFDKSKHNVQIVLTLSESSEETQFELVAQHDATRQEFTFDLVTDYSIYRQRFNEFFLPITVFINMPAGDYSFEVREKFAGKVIERGGMYVQGTAQEQFLTLPSNPADEEYITLDLNN